MTSPSPASVEPITVADRPVRCTGCGSAWTDADLAAAKLRDPRILSCCPERKPLTIDGLAARVVELEAALAAAAEATIDSLVGSSGRMAVRAEQLEDQLEAAEARVVELEALRMMGLPAPEVKQGD